jgi:hypothetical protein
MVQKAANVHACPTRMHAHGDCELGMSGAGITKSIRHPRAVDNSRIVRMDVFYSMWRNRTIPCPEGSGRPACETILLHREDFKISESLARFAVRHGMGSFVKNLTNGARKFINERRTRVDMVWASMCLRHGDVAILLRHVLLPHLYPFQKYASVRGSARLPHMCLDIVFGFLQFAEDPDAFGCKSVPNPPLLRSPSEFSLAGGLGDEADSPPTSDSDTDETVSQFPGPRSTSRRQRKPPVSAPRRFRSMVAAGLAVGFAYAVGRSTNPRIKAAKREYKDAR